MLKSSFDQETLTLEYYNKSKRSLYPINSNTLTVSKIHKFDHPIRLVVSFVNSPCYYLSKDTPLQEFNIHATKNSVEFSKFVTKHIPHGSILASLDVKNLFPSIPPLECIELVTGLLHNLKVSPLIISD